MNTRVMIPAVIDFAALYAKHAVAYDRVRTRSLMERPYLDLVATLRPAPATVLDVGCGPGDPLARYFIDKGYTVTGMDLVDQMLDLCRARFPEMTWVQGDMRTMALADRFDVVMAWDSFFHLPPDDQRQVLTRFRDHTAPGGVLLFTSGTDAGEAVGGNLCGDQLYHASLDTSEYRQRLESLGYTIRRHQIADPDCGGHTVWVAQLGA